MYDLDHRNGHLHWAVVAKKKRTRTKLVGTSSDQKKWAPKNDYAVGIPRISDFFH